MTAPLTPPDCDLRGLPFMPLDTARLLDSDLFALSTGDEFKAAVALWCKAWQQVPAGSLPNDDRILAHLSGAGARWTKMRAAALRGFVLCDDGRLYHPVIADKAIEAWQHRTAQRDRANKRWRATRGNAAASPAAHATASPDAHATAHATAMQGTGTGTGTGTTVPTVASLPAEPTGGLPAPPVPPGATTAKKPRPRPAKPAADGAKSAPVWQAYASAYVDRYATEPVRNARSNAMLCQLVDRLGDDAAPVAAWYVRRGNRQLYVASKHAVDLLLRDAEGLRTEWATGRTVTETQARQADRTAAIGNTFGRLIDNVRSGTDG